MHKIMCLDVGTKRIGVAVSDFLHITAKGLCYIDRIPENQAIDRLSELIKDNKVGELVIGVPKNMDGTEGGQAKDCRNFAELVKSNIPDVKIIFEDERLTSDTAEENLRERKIDFRKNKALVDIESACIILEQYLSKI